MSQNTPPKRYEKSVGDKKKGTGVLISLARVPRIHDFRKDVKGIVISKILQYVCWTGHLDNILAWFSKINESSVHPAFLTSSSPFVSGNVKKECRLLPLAMPWVQVKHVDMFLQMMNDNSLKGKMSSTKYSDPLLAGSRADYFVMFKPGGLKIEDDLAEKANSQFVGVWWKTFYVASFFFSSFFLIKIHANKLYHFTQLSS